MENPIKFKLNSLDKVQEFRFFLLLATLCFFLDNYFVVRFKTSLLYIEAATLKTQFHYGALLIVFTIYVFLISFLFPKLRALMILIFFPFLNKIFIDKIDIIKHPDVVYAKDVLEYGVKEKVQYYIELYKTHKAGIENTRKNYNLFFSLNLLIIINLLIGPESLLRQALMLISTNNRPIFLIFFGILLVSSLRLESFDWNYIHIGNNPIKKHEKSQPL